MNRVSGRENGPLTPNPNTHIWRPRRSPKDYTSFKTYGDWKKHVISMRDAYKRKFTPPQQGSVRRKPTTDVQTKGTLDWRRGGSQLRKIALTRKKVESNKQRAKNRSTRV